MAELVTVNHSVAGSNPASGVIHNTRGSTKDLCIERVPPALYFLDLCLRDPILVQTHLMLNNVSVVCKMLSTIILMTKKLTHDEHMKKCYLA